MAINLLALQPHKVSRDLSGYITYIYGAAKVGKTTFCANFPKPLILAFEKGYNALPGVYAQDITRWSEFKEVIRELKKPEVQEMYRTIIVDTIDVAGALCDKYICNQLGIDAMGDGGWGTNSWAKYKKELEDCFRTITQLGYALVCISHDQDKTFKRKDGSEYNQIVPTAQKSINNIIKDMADFYLYFKSDEITKERKIVFRSVDGTIDCGCRFPNVPAEIPMDYNAMVATVNKVIDNMAATNSNAVTNVRERTVVEDNPYDYDSLMAEFKDMVNKLMAENQTNAMKITSIVEKYLGRGKKVSDATPAQADFISLINTEIKDTLLNK